MSASVSFYQLFISFEKYLTQMKCYLDLLLNRSVGWKGRLRQTFNKEWAVGDIIFIGIAIGFFALCLGYMAFFEGV
jgi:hypothetical protein